MREAGSNIDYESFVIIDDRTLQDDTVLVVVKELLTEDEAAQATNAVRARFFPTGMLFGSGR